MKKVFFLMSVAALMNFNSEVKAQFYNPYYYWYYGIGYMPVQSGYYYGSINGGKPHGDGNFYGFDQSLGMVGYNGGFFLGVFHGKGILWCQYGYIFGEWYMGTLVKQINLYPNQVQSSYYQQAQTNYQTHVQPQSQRRLNLADVEVVQISNDSQLGKQMLGKIKK